MSQVKEITSEQINVEKLNEDIKFFDAVWPITEDMCMSHKGVSRLVMLDRYAFKDTELLTLGEGDFVILTVKEDPKFPARGTGYVQEIDRLRQKVVVRVSEEYQGNLEGEAQKTGLVTRKLNEISKPLEVFYEQVAKRVAWGLSRIEETEEQRAKAFQEFYGELCSLNFIPAGRVLYGAGSGKQVTYFNCYVMPFIQDSRSGISEHRKKVMEIMSRGGGVGTNGSTLRPRNTLARGVNGHSSGSVSWLHDLAELTNLVQQGGSRR